MRKFDVLIVGAGTSGLTARREVAKKTDNYLVVDNGPLGTTCARVGCMPSKVLIQVANDFHRRNKFANMGIHGASSLEVNFTEVMKHVQSLRDRFVRSVKGGSETWKDKFEAKTAKFIDANHVDLSGEKVFAEKIIVATGSRPVIPGPWIKFRSHLLTTDELFELETLPKTMAVIGLGVIGVELGQALNRLGVDVIAITQGKSIGGLTHPDLQEYVSQKLSEEMKIHFNGAELVEETNDGRIVVKADGQLYTVDKVLVSVGRRPNIDKIAIENAQVKLNEKGLPELNINGMMLTDQPHIFLPGDVNADRPILHEAADEGVMAGYNAVNEELCFKRRVSLGITFSDPNIAFVGERHQDLVSKNTEFVTGEVSFEGQGRSIVKLKEVGHLHVYASKTDGLILGAELFGPDGEHLAHLIAWAISLKLTVFEALQLPFYHPVIEEGLRTALRHCTQQIDSAKNNELARCGDSPIR